MISTTVALLVLLSAAMHAGWNFVVKASQDRFLDYTGIAAAGALQTPCRSAGGSSADLPDQSEQAAQIMAVQIDLMRMISDLLCLLDLVF